MPGQPQVELRPLRAEDADVFAGWGRDEEFCRHAGWGPGADHRGWWLRSISDPAPGLVRLAAVGGGALVGHVDLHGTEPGRRELGFLVGPRSAWGQGLGTRVAAAGLAYGRDELGLTEVWAEALDANRASVAILQRLGMRETGAGPPGEHLGVPTRWRRFTLSP